jgi:hypothetical protein
MGSKPTHRQRGVEILRCYGWEVEVVETFERPPGRPAYRRDLMGFADLLALRKGKTLAVQITSATNVGAHVRKLLGIRAVGVCLLAGWAVEVWGIRDRPAKDGSAIVFRSFYLTAAGTLAVIHNHSILKGLTNGEEETSG